MSSVFQYDIAERDEYFQLRNKIDQLDDEIKSNANAISALFETDDGAPWDENGLVNLPDSTWPELKKLVEHIRVGMIKIQDKASEMKEFREQIRYHESTLRDPSRRQLVFYFLEDELSQMIREETEDTDDSIYGVRMPFHYDILYALFHLIITSEYSFKILCCKIRSTEEIQSHLEDFELNAKSLGIYKCKFSCNGTRVYGGETLFELCPSNGPVEIVVHGFEQPHKPSLLEDFDSEAGSIDSHARCDREQLIIDYNAEFLKKFKDNFSRLKLDGHTWSELLWPIVDGDNNRSNDIGSSRDSGGGGWPVVDGDNNRSNDNGSSRDSGGGGHDNSGSSSDSDYSRFSGSGGD